MANLDAPMGFRPIRHKSGAPYNGAVNPYVVLSGETTIGIFIGDPVVRIGSANSAVITVPGAGTFGIGTLPTVRRSDVATAADAGDLITGIVVGVAADPTALETQYRVNSTERVLFVADDPDLIFEIQTNAAIEVDEVGLNITMVADHTGSTTTGLSGMELDGATAADDISDQLILVRAVNRVDNDSTLIHGKWEVRIAHHTEKNTYTAITGAEGIQAI